MKTTADNWVDSVENTIRETPMTVWNRDGIRAAYTSHVKPLEDALAAAKEREQVLVEALIETLRSLEIASRELSHEHKLVLGGKRWGGTAIDKARAALASVKEPS